MQTAQESSDERVRAGRGCPSCPTGSVVFDEAMPQNFFGFFDLFMAYLVQSLLLKFNYYRQYKML